MNGKLIYLVDKDEYIFITTINWQECQVTKERPSTLVRRLIATEKRLYD
ncbi:hypothetical protein [Lacticaseibacillus paracasei]|nr:hypothetical protein [Lacticaseibacillus paracasei]